jgi:hypothetical protein
MAKREFPSFGHEQLVERGCAWLYAHGCSVVLTDLPSSHGEQPDCIGWYHQWSTLIEVKVSRSDFFHDAEKPWRRDPKGRASGQRRFYLVPAGMIDIAEVPEGWGLLWAYPTTIRVKVDRKMGHLDLAILHREFPMLIAALARHGWGRESAVRAQPGLLERLERMERIVAQHLPENEALREALTSTEEETTC